MLLWTEVFRTDSKTTDKVGASLKIYNTLWINHNPEICNHSCAFVNITSIVQWNIFHYEVIWEQKWAPIRTNKLLIFRHNYVLHIWETEVLYKLELIARL